MATRVRRRSTAAGSSTRSGRAQRHHLCSDKHRTVYTRQFVRLFRPAGLSLRDRRNKVLLPGHKGRHSPRYHQYVLQALEAATEGLSGSDYRAALCGALAVLRLELLANPDLVRGVGL